MSNEDADGAQRAETLAALPHVLAVLRRMVMTTFEPGDPEGDELRNLLDACVVGAHRLQLREQLRANGGQDQG